MNQKIKIDFVSSAKGDHLKDCYFVQTSDGTFDFHDKNGHRVHQNIPLGSSFEFNFPGDSKTWMLTLGEVLHVEGSWKDGPGDAEGSYQAQAGGSGAGEEGAASAYA